MYYTRLEPSLERKESNILLDLFGSQLSNSKPPQLLENSRLSLVNTSTITLDNGDKLLLLNKELATWTFLEGRERVLYDYLGEGIPYHVLLTASLSKVNGIGGPERLNGLLAHLYDRGMLSVDGKTGVNQQVYKRGPLFTDIPMLELLITRRCNLGCAYCFAEDNQRKHDMDLKIAVKAVDHLLKMPFRNFCIKFNGGEPLLRKDLLQKISRYTVEKFQDIKGEGYLLFEVTTNGTLIDAEAIELFKEFNMRVLISIDGPEPLHNKARAYLNGAPSFNNVMRGLKRVQNAEYPFRAITVVARHSLSHVREIMDFFAQAGVENVRFNPVLKHGRGKHGWQDFGIKPVEYVSFMENVATRCYEDDSVREDNLQSMLRNMVYRTRNFRCMRSNCGCGHDYLCVDTNGDIYPCAYFRAETPALRLGNIQGDVNFEQCGQKHPVVRTFPSRMVEKIEACSRCDWRHFCEGGCTLGAYVESKTVFAPTYLCDYFKNMYPFLFAKLAEKRDFVQRLLREEVKMEYL